MYPNIAYFHNLNKVINVLSSVYKKRVIKEQIQFKYRLSPESQTER